jgi:starch synthase (maltosyl-transferring)
VALPKTKEPPARIQIQAVAPQVDCGTAAIKRTLGELLDVEASIFRDGHDVLGAAVRYKAPGETRWREAPLEPLGNDRWRGSFELASCGRWSYRIEAWVDRIASFQDELRRKVDAGQEDLAGELAEAAVLLGHEVTVEDVLAAPAGARSDKATSQSLEVDVDRELARFGAWYELFPRSWAASQGCGASCPGWRSSASTSST